MRLTVNSNIKEEADKMVKEDEDVLFWWEVLCSIVGINNETAKTLFILITHHYITVRGFALTASGSKWLNQIKKGTFKSLRDSERSF